MNYDKVDTNILIETFQNIIDHSLMQMDKAK